MIDLQINEIINNVLLAGEDDRPKSVIAAEATAAILALLVVPTEASEEVTPVQRAHDTVLGLSSLVRAYTGPDDAIAAVALEEGEWLGAMLLSQRREEDAIVAKMAKTLFLRDHPDRSTWDANEEETERYYGNARAVVSLAVLAK